MEEERRKNKRIDKWKKIIIIIGLVGLIIELVVGLAISILKEDPEDDFEGPERNAVRFFNRKFTKYEGICEYEHVCELISDVENSNLEEKEHQIEIYNSEIIKANKEYKISLEYDDDGYINKINIIEQR